MPKTTVARFGASQRQGKSATKNYSRFKPRNPLKSLDSDERIQGNPRQSNPHEQGSSQRNGQGPRKTQTDRPDRYRGSATEKEPNRRHPKAKRARLRPGRRLAPRRLDLFQRAASRLRHADDDPDEADGAERGEHPEGVGLPDRLDDRQEESADQEGRAPVDRRRHRHGPAANFPWIDLVDDGPGDRAEGECERDDEHDKRDERDDARRTLARGRCSGLLEGETDGGEAESHADEARD